MQKILFSVFLIAALLATAGCTQTAQPGQNTNLENNNFGEAQTAVLSIKYFDSNNSILLIRNFEVEKGTNAFEAMKNNLQLEYEMFGNSAFITSIAGTPAPEGYYIALYVDGTYADKGISDYAIKKDTLIEWKTEAIEDFGE